MKQKRIVAAALALCLSLTACGNKKPSLEEVEAAIEDGSVTVQDALEKGWVTQEWADSYLEENTVPAADKIAINAVGDFRTETLSGEPFTNEDMPNVAFVVFLDPEDEGSADFYQNLVDAAEGVRAAGADLLVCNKGSMDATLFQNAPFSVVAYNDSMKKALAQNDEMASGIPCTGVWYVNGSLISAWISKIDAEDLVQSAESYVSMAQEDTNSSTGNSMSALPMG